MALQQYITQARVAPETDRRHLLSSDNDSIAPSESASRAPTIYADGDGDRTPRAQSPQRSSTVADITSVQHSYNGFPSEAHYLAALKTWADSKRYIEPGDNALIGYYGETTMQEYASRPKVEFGLSRMIKAKKQKKAEDTRRKSAV